MKNLNNHRVGRHKHKVSTTPSGSEPVIAKKISSMFRISEDVLAKAPIITSHGNYRVYIENYRKIIEYTDQQIKILTKTGKISISGEKLVIAYYEEDDLCIIGNIFKVEYR